MTQETFDRWYLEPAEVVEFTDKGPVEIIYPRMYMKSHEDWSAIRQELLLKQLKELYQVYAEECEEQEEGVIKL